MVRPEPARIAAAYRRFADEDARGRSPLYEALATGVAGDPEIIEFLMALPREKRQPNLLLAAVRHLFGTAGGYAEFRRHALDNRDAVRSLMLARSTQTNEPGRCAALLPVLAMLPQPLALIEVGASAGLCLLPDFYGYDYGGHRLRPSAEVEQPPVFPCEADHRTPLPAAPPQIVWRAGLDLNPLDLADREQVGWLETLVWPEQTERLARLQAAIRVAAMNSPRLVRGDLRHDLGRLAAEAPPGATLVIFHTAVLGYVSDAAERAGFAASVGSRCDFWLSNEAPQVFPEIAARAGDATAPGRFLVSVNGNPVARADPHGAALDWIADPPLDRDKREVEAGIAELDAGEALSREQAVERYRRLLRSR
jgi:hypothetical protein